MAVIGLDHFAEFFRGFGDCYTVIGGTACDILMSAYSTRTFRATKDLDMIVLMEDRFEEFAVRFWQYIREGGYTCGWKKDTDPHFYRFTEPKEGYPKQIELFSRKPEYHLQADVPVIPLHIDDDVSSLSAILLDDDFYDFMMSGRTELRGISILQAAYLIPFKMYAWLNLRQEKAQGHAVNDRDLRKHKNDVFQLMAIVPEGTHIQVWGHVEDAVERFVTEIRGENIVFRDLGIDSTMDTELKAVRELFGIKEQGA